MFCCCFLFLHKNIINAPFMLVVLLIITLIIIFERKNDLNP